MQPADPGYLGSRQATGVLSPANLNVAGAWVVTFRPQDMPVEPYDVYHIALKGPRGNFQVYIDDAFYSAAVRSDLNEYDPKQTMHVRPGQTITFHFSSTTTPQPVVNLWLRQPGAIIR